MGIAQRLTFTGRYQARVRVWMRDNYRKFDTAKELADEATWQFCIYETAEHDDPPAWVMAEAKELIPS